MKTLKITALVAVFSFVALPALAGDDTSITIPWGQYAVDLLGFISAILLPFIGVKLHALLDAKIGKEQTDRVEQLLEKAIAYGINATSGAVADKALTKDIGNAVLAQAANYAIANAPKLVEWAGGAEAIEKKILARLNLEASSGS